MSKRKKKSRPQEKQPWFWKQIPQPLLWAALLVDLIALGTIFGQVVMAAAGWLVSPPGLAVLLLLNMIVTIFTRGR